MAPAETPPGPAEPAPPRSHWVELTALVQNLFLYDNDRDFDRSEPLWNTQGQTVGFLGTFFRPRLTLNATEWLRLRYEVELGLNIWSQHDTEEGRTGESDAFLIRHRELYAEGALPGTTFDFRVGYQRIFDPTGLLIGHWAGAMDLGFTREHTRYRLQLGQLPDQTYEGIDAFGGDANNLLHDLWIGSLGVDRETEARDLRAALYVLWDRSDIREERQILAPAARWDERLGALSLGLGAMLQLGVLAHHDLGDRHAMHLAWALQTDASYRIARWSFEAHAMQLSADDGADHNATSGAFLYSGRSRSRTLILTEDEIRDMGRNLDERIGERHGLYQTIRGGLGVADLSASLRMGSLTPTLIAGVGWMIAPENAMGSSLVGTELDLDLAFRSAQSDLLELHVVGGVLIPGEAASASINAIDPDATDPVYQLEASFSARF